jgi:hypothetical protein
MQTKPTVSLEESCNKATAIVVVKSTADTGVTILKVLYDNTKAGLNKDTDIAIA